MPIHTSTEGQNVVFENVLDKRRYFIIEGNDIHFITNMSGTVVWDDCCAEVAIKQSTYHSQLDYFDTKNNVNIETFNELPVV